MGRRVRKQVFLHNGTGWNPAPESEKLFVYEGWNVVKETTVTVPKAGNRAAGRGTAAGCAKPLPEIRSALYVK
ncbi:MAG: hypothetical protein AB7S75_24665 [Desulfococcaceae bacterium]